jgi:uncharacterized protein YidB (DUF937 family)
VQPRTSRDDEVQRLRAALLAEITSPACGGLKGFLALFSAAGFSGLVHAWLAHDAYAMATATQIRYALGGARLARLANEAGMSVGTAAMVLASMVPGVIHRLTPGGRVPDLHELRDLIDGRDGSTIDASQDAEAIPRVRSGAARYGVAIASILLIALAAWWSLHGHAQPSRPDGGSQQPVLVLRHGEGGAITASGALPDGATREVVIAALRRTLPASDWGADFRIDPAIAKPVWLTGLDPLLPLLRITKGAEIRFEGDSFAVGGTLSEAERATLRQELSVIFGNRLIETVESTPRRD